MSTIHHRIPPGPRRNDPKTSSKKEALYIDSVCGTQVFYLFVLCSHNNISLLQRGITTFVGTRTADDV